MPKVSDQMKVHEVLEDLFFEHQKALLNFDLDKAQGYLRSYESTLLAHMADEEEIFLPVYAERADYPPVAAPTLFYDEHKKMRSYVELFKRRVGEIASEENMERALLDLLADEAFYIRLCGHHDRREGKYLYPILDETLSEAEKTEMLERASLRGGPQQ